MASKELVSRLTSKNSGADIQKWRRPPLGKLGNSVKTRASRADSAYGSGRRSTAFTTLKMAVVAPIPSPKHRTAAVVKPGFFARRRTPYLRFCAVTLMTSLDGEIRNRFGLSLGLSDYDQADGGLADFDVQDPIVVTFLGDRGEVGALRGFHGKHDRMGSARSFGAVLYQGFEIGLSGRVRVASDRA